MGPGGAKAPPPIGLAPPPMILVIVQYSLIAIAKILLLNAVNGLFDSYAKMYFVRVAVQFYIYTRTSLEKILTEVLLTHSRSACTRS